MRCLLLTLCVAVLGAEPLAAQATGDGSACPPGEAVQSCYERGLRLASESTQTDPDTRPALRAQAVQVLQATCLRGMGDACHLAGRLVDAVGLEVQLGTAEDGLAARLFEEGCHATRPSGEACNALGDAYAYGLGRSVSSDSAFYAFDRGCRLGNASACFRVAARYPHREELGPSRFAREAELTERACREGSAGGCLNLGYSLEVRLSRVPPAERGTADYQRDRERVRQHYRRTCEQGQMIGCNNYGAILAHGKFGFPVVADSAWHYYTLACRGHRGANGASEEELGEGIGCRNLGVELLSGRLVPADTARALTYFRQGCQLHDAEACGYFAQYGFASQQIPNNIALLHAATACHEGSGYGCSVTGWLFQQQYFDDRTRAEAYFERACRLEHSYGCEQRAILFERRDSVSSAAKYYRRACELESDRGCYSLALLLEMRFGAAGQASSFYRRACDLGNAEGCWRTMHYFHALGDYADEGVYRSKACSLDRAYCKKKTPSTSS